MQHRLPPGTRLYAQIRVARRNAGAVLSQLEFARALHRAVRRAELPILYSGGFSPRPRMSFAFPLPVGVSSDGELVALQLAESVPSLELARRLRRQLPEGLELERQEVRRGSLRASLLHVRTPESGAPAHRHLRDLRHLVQRSSLSVACQERAAAILTRIARAESRVHGIGVEDVHFHEVGAVDTLIDVCGAVHALECLGVERVIATPPFVGGGSVHCAHGEMPVPAPGTAELLRGLPCRYGVGGERLTPTGAALLAELVDEFLGPESEAVGIVSSAIGVGAGHRDPMEGPPNLVRVSLARPLAAVVPAAVLATDNSTSRTAWPREARARRKTARGATPWPPTPRTSPLGHGRASWIP